jgi:hypothetical protein
LLELKQFGANRSAPQKGSANTYLENELANVAAGSFGRNASAPVSLGTTGTNNASDCPSSKTQRAFQVHTFCFADAAPIGQAWIFLISWSAHLTDSSGGIP